MSVRAAIVTNAGGRVEVVDDVDIDEPRAGEALVAIELAGVCGSDLAVQRGKIASPMPVILGHEAVARVVALGPETDGPAPGSRVIVWMRPACRDCRACRRGDAALCSAGGMMPARFTLLDGRTSFTRGGEPLYRTYGVGAFATRTVLPVGALIPVPDDIPDEAAALMGCGVATGAGAVFNVADPRPGDVVVVFGAGGVGLSAVMTAAALEPAAVVVVEPGAERRRLALQLGATHAFEPSDAKSLRATIRAEVGADADVAIDAVGDPRLVETGFRIVGNGGAVVAVGLQPREAEVSLPGAHFPLSLKRVLGAVMGAVDPQRDFPRLFDLYRRGALPVDRLVSDHIGLDGVPHALDALAGARGLRTIVDVAGG